MNIEILEIIDNIKDQTKYFGEFSERDIIKISRKASATFFGILSEDEIETCILNALWKAIQKYDINSKCKFTTYLYNGVIMECLTQKKFNAHNPTLRIYENIISANNKDIEKIDMLDELNTCCEDPDLIFDRFYNNMTVKEIALSRGVCSETIRVKINKNLGKLRLKMVKLSV